MVLGGVLLLEACSRLAVESDERGAAPDIAELRNASFNGIYDTPLTLLDGLWEGEPFVEGASSRPRAGIAGDFYAAGDINADGSSEAAVIIWENSGGSGSFHYLAVCKRAGEVIENIDTVMIEDRPRILGLQIAGNRVLLELIQHGPGEPACCPTQRAVRRWHLASGKLLELPAEIVPP